MFRLIARLALRGFDAVEPRLSIVLFHRVLSSPDPMLESEPDCARFAQLMQWLRAAFTVLPLRDALARLQAGKLPPGTVCITFDDGYRDNASNALPILLRLGLPATFFVTTRYLDGGLMWNDRVIEAVRVWPRAELDLSPYGLEVLTLENGRRATAERILSLLKYLPFERRDIITSDLLKRSGARLERMMMDANEIRRLYRAGMEVGGHTVSHPILSVIDDREARRQINDNKAALESIIGAEIETFAYPNGRPLQDYDGRHVSMVRECGYRYALTTATGTTTRTTDHWQIPRFTPWDRQRAKFLARMLQNYFHDAAAVEEPARAADGA